MSARSFCSRHYQRWKNHGDPLAPVIGRKRRWEPEELQLLEDMIEEGRSDAFIGKRLNCTANAVNIARKRHKIAPRRKVLLTSRSVQVRLGVSCAKTVAWWIREGWLKGRKGQRVGLNRMWYVTEDALQQFLENRAYWHLWEPDKIIDRDFRVWAKELRKVRYLTTGEVGQRFCVQHTTVNDWIHRGLLPAVRHGNWRVLESDLQTFVPPYERSHKGTPQRRFNRDEDHCVVRMRAEGKSWQHIADALGRDLGSVHGRYVRLQERPSLLERAS